MEKALWLLGAIVFIPTFMYLFQFVIKMLFNI
jgi:hypothetical protein